MSNRTLLILVSLFLLAIGSLFVKNFLQVIKVEKGEAYMQYNDIRGMAVVYQGKPFTLNFEQQTAAVRYLNTSEPIDERNIQSKGTGELRGVEKIIIYRFEGQSDIMITPIRYVDSNLVFSAPQWRKEGYLIEKSNGKLKALLTETYPDRDSK